MGKHDRRNSMKMKRRKAQVKLKARLKRQSKERRAVTGQAGKKPSTPKKGAKGSAAAPATATPET